MHLSRMKLVNFRNYKELELSFHDNINILIGDNAQGKTSLLEAVYVLSRGKSYKNNASDCIHWEKESSLIEGNFHKEHFDDHIRIAMSKSNNTQVFINEKKTAKRSILWEKIQVVLFSPEDLKMIKDGPDQRRKFIDNELNMIRPSYGNLLKDYGRVLSQRNNLLKSLRIDPHNKNTLEIWDEQLVSIGKKIILSRIQFLKKINSITKKIHYRLTNEKEDLKLFYISNMIKNNEDIMAIEEIYRKSLNDKLKEDILRGYTSTGPHADDIKVVVNDFDVKTYGSQGQQRTAALSLKLSEIEIIKEEIKESPIILLDDVMSELDSKRQEKIIEYFHTSQVIITCTEMNFEKSLQNFDKKIFTIEDGSIVGIR